MITITKPKKFTYRIQYVDNTYQVVDWTKDEFKVVGRTMAEGKQVILMEDVIVRLDHIRAIVFLPPVPELTKEELEMEKQKELTEWGGYDPEVTEWLKSQGIDITKGVN